MNTCKNKIKLTLCLLALTAASSLYAETASIPGGRSPRSRAQSAKPGPNRQVFVAPDVDHVFPYILASGTWTTTFYLTNLEDREIKVECEFVGTNGEEKSFKFNFQGPNDEPGAFIATTIPKFATDSYSIVSSSTAPLSTAWAYCNSDPRLDRFSGYAVVRNTATNGVFREFVTGLHPESEPVFSVPFIDSATGSTALILLNSSLDTDSSLALSMFDREGKTVGTSTVVLKPGNLRLLVLNDVFKDVKNGTVRVVLAEGSQRVTGLALRSNAGGFVPLHPLTPKEAPPEVAPQ